MPPTSNKAILALVERMLRTGAASMLHDELQVPMGDPLALREDCDAVIATVREVLGDAPELQDVCRRHHRRGKFNQG